MGVTRTRYGTYIARWYDPWGRRVSQTFKYKTDADVHYRKVLGDMANGTYADRRRGKVTVAAWADDWLAGARNLSTGGRDTYRRDLDRHILPKLGKMPLGKLSPTLIDRFLSELDLAPSTVHRQYRTLHRMLRVAVDRGLLQRNPCDPVQPPVIPRVERTVLDVDQVDALAAAISPRYRAWVLTMAYGGLRWGESIGLRRMDVDMPRVTIASQLVRRGKTWERSEPKTRSRRTVTLPSFAADVLKDHVDRFSQPGPAGLVFCTRNGTPPQSSSFRANIFGRALAKAGLPHVRIHDLRHTAVSLAIAAGADPKASQARAGHSSIGVHLDVYGHLYPAADAAVAAALDNLHAEAQRARLRVV